MAVEAASIPQRSTPHALTRELSHHQALRNARFPITNDGVCGDTCEWQKNVVTAQHFSVTDLRFLLTRDVRSSSMPYDAFPSTCNHCMSFPLPPSCLALIPSHAVSTTDSISSSSLALSCTCGRYRLTAHAIPTAFLVWAGKAPVGHMLRIISRHTCTDSSSSSSGNLSDHDG